jgi:hypothetical protein
VVDVGATDVTDCDILANALANVSTANVKKGSDDIWTMSEATSGIGTSSFGRISVTSSEFLEFCKNS